MSVFKIDSRVFEKLPDVCFGAVVAKGVDNSRDSSEIRGMLASEAEAIRVRLDGVNLKEYPGILPYRDAFLALGINPNKFMSSIEALAKRALKGAELPLINPIVDIGNAMSLKYILPMGAHDIGKLSGDLEVRFAAPGDSFTPFGEVQPETPDADELVYVSGNTVKTRRWIWRQSEDGKIDAETRDVIFPIDGFTSRNGEAVLAAQKELSELLVKLFDCTVTTGLLTAEKPAIAL